MVTKTFFGKTSQGSNIYAYRIENERRIAVTVLDYGATLQSVVLPHKGAHVDILLGYDSIAAYEQNDSYLGASIGRYAGRIPDAIALIGSDAFPVTVNDGKNHLHGGRIGFDKRVWDAAIGEDSVTFSLRSPDGDEGFPGAMRCSAEYALSDDLLTLTYRGISDRTTAWNPTNHGYWNLNGHDAGDARQHCLMIPAKRYVPVGSDLIPTGEDADVSGTRFDFLAMRTIDGEYDHCFVLSGGPIRLFGTRGIGMEISTDCKAVQFYTARYLSERRGKGGAIYRPFGAVCLETEGRQAHRATPIPAESILTPGVENTRTTQFRFLFEED